MPDTVPIKRPVGRPPKLRPALAAEPESRSDKVPYQRLAEELCDWIITATEGHPREGRFFVCQTAMKYALRLLPQRYVKQTKRAT